MRRENEKKKYTSENPTIRDIQLSATNMGGRLFRNSTGKYRDLRGNWVSYGLCVGSSDLIGFLPLTIAGFTLPIFTGVEVKYGKTVTTQEQFNFREMIIEHHGIGLKVYSCEEFERDAKQILSNLAKILENKWHQ
jgi:hypothetical protein